eukprot:1168823-Alexandrium_andersonii.AAC.1
MMKYHESVGSVGSAVHVLPQWSWSQYREYEKCEQQVRKRKIGSMMHEDCRALVLFGFGGVGCPSLSCPAPCTLRI